MKRERPQRRKEEIIVVICTLQCLVPCGRGLRPPFSGVEREASDKKLLINSLLASLRLCGSHFRFSGVPLAPYEVAHVLKSPSGGRDRPFSA